MSRTTTIVAFCCFLSAGCSHWEEAKFNGGEGAEDKLVLLVPLSELRHNRWYTESEPGGLVVLALERWVRENTSEELVAGEAVLARIRDWPTNRIEARDWRRLMVGVEADYVVVGDIKEIQLSSPKKVGIVDAFATVRYRVLDAKTGLVVHRNEDLTRRVGRRGGGDFAMPIPDMNVDKRSLRRRLARLLGEAIGQEMYGYYRE